MTETISGLQISTYLLSGSLQKTFADSWWSKPHRVVLNGWRHGFSALRFVPAPVMGMALVLDPEGTTHLDSRENPPSAPFDYLWSFTPLVPPPDSPPSSAQPSVSVQPLSFPNPVQERGWARGGVGLLWSPVQRRQEARGKRPKINFLHLYLLYVAVFVSKQGPHNSFILLPLRGSVCAPFPWIWVLWHLNQRIQLKWHGACFQTQQFLFPVFWGLPIRIKLPCCVEAQVAWEKPRGEDHSGWPHLP